MTKRKAKATSKKSYKKTTVRRKKKKMKKSSFQLRQIFVYLFIYPFAKLIHAVRWLLRNYPFAGWGFLLLLILSIILWLNILLFQPKTLPQGVFFNMYNEDSHKLIQNLKVYWEKFISFF